MTALAIARRRAPALLAMTFLVGVATATAVACVSDRSTSNTTLATTNCTAPTTTAGATIVYIRDFVFDPAVVHVKPGGSVAWVNCEATSIPHTSTSDAGVWTSGSLAPGAAYVRVFADTGSFAYHCAIHPSMKASVAVN